jgi:hypothetical protein
MEKEFKLNEISALERKKEAKSYRKVASAACFGTFLEWYDFLTFATLAVTFGPFSFPAAILRPAFCSAWLPLALAWWCDRLGRPTSGLWETGLGAGPSS